MHWTLILAVVAVALFTRNLDALLLIAILVASVFLHELAHAFVARARGVHVDGIELGIFGGAVRLVRGPRVAGTELAIAVAGPIASGALALLTWVMHAVTNDWIALFALFVNGGIFLINALPILPLDGGRALRGLLARSRSWQAATRTAAWANVVVALALVAGAVWIDSVPIGLMSLAMAVAIVIMGRIEVARADVEAQLER